MTLALIVTPPGLLSPEDRAIHDGISRAIRQLSTASVSEASAIQQRMASVEERAGAAKELAKSAVQQRSQPFTQHLAWADAVINGFKASAK